MSAFNQDPSNVQKNQDLFVYGNVVSSIAAGASATSQISIDADSNFFAVKFNCFATISGAAVTSDTRPLPLVTLQITDSGSGRNLLNTPLPLPVICGYAELPGILPINRLFRGNSTITLQFTNYSAVTTYRIDYGFIGIKQFNY